MLSIFKYFYRNNAPERINPDPFKRDQQYNESLDHVPSQPTPPRRVMRREEIIDAKTRIAGYRFSVVDSNGHPISNSTDALQVLSDNNLADFAARRLTLIPIAAKDWGPTCHQLVGTNTIFQLELPRDADEFQQWVNVAREIRNSGACVAISGQALGPRRELVTAYADFLLMDFPSCSLRNLDQLVASLKGELPLLQLIATNVTTWSERRICNHFGISYCLGPFSTTPDEDWPDSDMNLSQNVMLGVLNKLREEASPESIAEEAKQDPAVVMKIISMANSPVLGLQKAVTSIEQAILVVGRDQLYQWLIVLLFGANAASERDSLILERALSRARFLELLARDSGAQKQRSDEFFLVGLLSLVEQLLGLSLSVIIQKLGLPPAMVNVLESYEGPLGHHLRLAIAVEKGEFIVASDYAARLNYSDSAVENAALQSITWAREAVRVGTSS